MKVKKKNYGKTAGLITVGVITVIAIVIIVLTIIASIKGISLSEYIVNIFGGQIVSPDNITEITEDATEVALV